MRQKEARLVRIGVVGAGPISQAAHFEACRKARNAHVYRLQLEGFADTTLHGTPLHGASVEDCVAALRALVAISRSVETGAWVTLAKVTGGV